MDKKRFSLIRFFSIIAIFACSFVLIYCSSDQSTSENNAANQSAVGDNADTPELADAMGSLQRYTHKYALAVEAENQELARFYFHEVRATIDEIKDEIPGYEGYDIRRFTTMFLDPTIEPVEEALKTRDWEDIREKTITMVNACNSCHRATNHGFIQVTPGFDNNPYNQQFTVPE